MTEEKRKAWDAPRVRLTDERRYSWLDNKRYGDEETTITRVKNVLAKQILLELPAGQLDKNFVA